LRLYLSQLTNAGGLTSLLFLSQITSLTLFSKEPFGESFERGNRAIAVKMAK